MTDSSRSARRFAVVDGNSAGLPRPSATLRWRIRRSQGMNRRYALRCRPRKMGTLVPCVCGIRRNAASLFSRNCSELCKRLTAGIMRAPGGRSRTALTVAGRPGSRPTKWWRSWALRRKAAVALGWRSVPEDGRRSPGVTGRQPRLTERIRFRRWRTESPPGPGWTPEPAG